MLVAGLRVKAVERVDQAGTLRGRTVELSDGSNGVRERMKDDLQTFSLDSWRDWVVYLLRGRFWKKAS